MKRRLLALAAMVAMTSGSLLALDANDIGQLLRNGVQEPVIINMVKANRLTAPLRAQEVLALNAAGASSTLLEFLTRPESAMQSAASVTALVQQAPVTVLPSTTAASACAPTYVAAPAYVVPRYYTTPTYVYPREYYGSRPMSFSFYYGRGWGGHGPRYGRNHRHYRRR